MALNVKYMSFMYVLSTPSFMSTTKKWTLGGGCRMKFTSCTDLVEREGEEPYMGYRQAPCTMGEKKSIYIFLFSSFLPVYILDFRKAEYVG